MEYLILFTLVAIPVLLIYGLWKLYSIAESGEFDLLGAMDENRGDGYSDDSDEYNHYSSTPVDEGFEMWKFRRGVGLFPDKELDKELLKVYRQSKGYK